MYSQRPQPISMLLQRLKSAVASLMQAFFSILLLLTLASVWTIVCTRL